MRRLLRDRRRALIVTAVLVVVSVSVYGAAFRRAGANVPTAVVVRGEFVDVVELPTHGGSLRIYARHAENDAQQQRGVGPDAAKSQAVRAGVLANGVGLLFPRVAPIEIPNQIDQQEHAVDERAVVLGLSCPGDRHRAALDKAVVRPRHQRGRPAVTDRVRLPRNGSRRRTDWRAGDRVTEPIGVDDGNRVRSVIIRN